MNQYCYPLLMLTLAAISTFNITPSQAQTLSTSNSDQTNTIISPTSSEISPKISTTEPSAFGSSATSTNSNQTIFSEVNSDASSASTISNHNKPDFRVPISSRIFSVPSMRQ
jgi:hypothetical protein